MSTKNTGGPAFPHDMTQFDRDMAGMNLRDWFAGQALAGMSANPSLTMHNFEKFARWSYDQADAMLAEREK